MVSDLSNDTREEKANPHLWGVSHQLCQLEHPESGWLGDSICLFQPIFMCLPLHFAFSPSQKNPFCRGAKLKEAKNPRRETEKTLVPGILTREARGKRAELMGKRTAIIRG